MSWNGCGASLVCQGCHHDHLQATGLFRQAAQADVDAYVLRERSMQTSCGPLKHLGRAEGIFWVDGHSPDQRRSLTNLESQLLKLVAEGCPIGHRQPAPPVWRDGPQLYDLNPVQVRCTENRTVLSELRRKGLSMRTVYAWKYCRMVVFRVDKGNCLQFSIENLLKILLQFFYERLYDVQQLLKRLVSLFIWETVCTTLKWCRLSSIRVYQAGLLDRLDYLEAELVLRREHRLELEYQKLKESRKWSHCGYFLVFLIVLGAWMGL